MKYEVPEYGIVKLRAFRDWEASVPIYLEVDQKGGKNLVSGPFYYAPPDAVKNQSLDITIGTYGDVFYIKDKSNEKVVLAMVSISKGLIYPPNNIESKQYSIAIDNIFDELKQHLGESTLELRW